MSEVDRDYECANPRCGSEVRVPDDVDQRNIADWLEEEGWSRTGPEDDGQWLCPDCDAASMAGDE